MKIFLLIVAALWVGLLHAQVFSLPAATDYDGSMRLDHTLFKYAKLHEQTKGVGFLEAARKHLACLADGRVNFSMVNESSRDYIDLEYLRSLGLEVLNHAGRRAKCAVSPDRLLELSQDLRPGYFMQAITVEPQNNEGPMAMNSAGYNLNGNGGQGITIGIMDYNFDKYLEAANNGQVPSNYQLYNPTNRSFGTDGTSTHGTGCAEIVFDHAPGAQYYLMMVDSDSTDWVNAIDSAIANGVDIISCSLGPHNTGWDDDSGFACQAANNAANNGILFFVSAGNEAREHYIGDFIDADNDLWHEFEPNDEGNTYILGPGRTLTVWLQWDADPPLNYYNLYLYNTSGGFPLITSQNITAFESLSYANPSNTDSMSVDIRVLRQANNPPRFELFTTDESAGNDLFPEFITPESSLESPANSTHANVISVGAVNWSDYDSQNTAEVIANYSSQGPTHGGVIAPDICAPTACTTFSNVSTFNPTGSFTGTSCAAPNAAGAAAAFWSKHPTLGADGVRQIITAKALAYRDWGTPGQDNFYGWGGLILYSYDANNRYVHENSGNSNGNDQLPYTSLQQADQYAPANKHFIFLGQSHDAPPPGTVIDKPMLIKSAGREVNSEIE